MSDEGLWAAGAPKQQDAEPDEDLELEEAAVDPQQIAQARTEIIARCKNAGIPIEEKVDFDGEPYFKLGIRCGRELRTISVFNDDGVTAIRSIPFEKFIFLSDYNAICSYEKGYIEALVRPLGTGFVSQATMLRRLFGRNIGPPSGPEIPKIQLNPAQPGFPRIELSGASKEIAILTRPGMPERYSRTLSLKLTECAIDTHDKAVSLLEKTANALFFQIDLLTGIAVGLDRERKPIATRTPTARADLTTDLQYPKTELDNAPVSLYWYARSATGMPLLQFLAFYQVVEFYFPTYAKAEAQRRLKAILKEPTFRGDRDADVGRLLSAIHVSRSGAYGDERSQLRATIAECVDPNDLRTYLESNEERKQFYTGKGVAKAYHKVPLANPTADLRNDIADRIYSIRCRIVHTKDDASENARQLLPFSEEASQLSPDIELVQYVARQVLFNGSTQFQPNA